MPRALSCWVRLHVYGGGREGDWWAAGGGCQLLQHCAGGAGVVLQRAQKEQSNKSPWVSNCPVIKSFFSIFVFNLPVNLFHYLIGVFHNMLNAIPIMHLS